MISKSKNNVAWSLLHQGLDDARAHLVQLVKEMAEQEDYGEEEFRIDLGHVYAHLNRAWNSRNIPRELTDQEWHDFGMYPKDLEPIA